MKHRRSLRLKGYDYAEDGAYFITICVQGRARLFGEIEQEKMRLNDAGRMIERWWLEVGRKFHNIKIDKYVIMPNHFHGIIIIVDHDQSIPDATAPGTMVGADLCVCPKTRGSPGAPIGAPQPPHQQPPTQKTNIAPWFKIMTTNEYIREVKRQGWPPFCARLWQRNYYEHIIRDESSLRRIQKYIQDNPARWAFDRENRAQRSP